jgi:hypothetical protein
VAKDTAETSCMRAAVGKASQEIMSRRRGEGRHSTFKGTGSPGRFDFGDTIV